jgi:hypothetical protein
MSNEALCLLKRITSIDIKMEETAQLYQLTRGNTKDKAQFDSDMDVKNWQHPAETTIKLMEENDEKNPIQIFTDGSKTEKWLGSGIAIFESGHYIKILQCRLNKRYTKNQAEQLAILTALKYIENIQTTDRRATIYTHNQITLDKLQNSNILTHI